MNQQFTVPQFIDVEDKIIGTITARQFIILLVGFIVDAIFYRLFDFSLFLFVAVLNLCVFGTFAFVRINGRPFHFFALNMIQTFRKSRLRVWNHILSKTGTEEWDEIPEVKIKEALPEKNYSVSRLAELALIVDTQGAYRGEVKLDQGKIMPLDEDHNNLPN